jgi:hypothetical protein
MPNSITVDLITYDPTHDEFVIYFVLDGPWPVIASEWASCLQQIQNKVLDATDMAVDGGLVRQFPESLGKKVRIQLDSPHGCPNALTDLVSNINSYIATSEEYTSAIQSSKFIQAVRVVTGHEMGRFAAGGEG